MFRELYKEVKNILEMNNIVISYNNVMSGLMSRHNIDFFRLRRCHLPKNIQKLIDGGISFINIGGIQYLSFNENPTFELFYTDIIGNEFSNNKIYIESNAGIKQALLIALTLAQNIFNLLLSSKINGTIIVGVDVENEECSCSFFQKLNGEEWLQDNLENYNEGLWKLTISCDFEMPQKK